jgi:hypothetical protein
MRCQPPASASLVTQRQRRSSHEQRDVSSVGLAEAGPATSMPACTCRLGRDPVGRVRSARFRQRDAAARREARDTGRPPGATSVAFSIGGRPSPVMTRAPSKAVAASWACGDGLASPAMPRPTAVAIRNVRQTGDELARMAASPTGKREHGVDGSTRGARIVR